MTAWDKSKDERQFDDYSGGWKKGHIYQSQGTQIYKNKYKVTRL